MRIKGNGMRKFIILAFLMFLCGLSFGADYYVATATAVADGEIYQDGATIGNGSDASADATNSATPWLTIQKALNTVADEDTVYVSSGLLHANTGGQGDSIAYLSAGNGNSDKDVELIAPVAKTCTIKGNAQTIIGVSSLNAEYTFTNFTITTDHSNTNVLRNDTVSTSFVLNDCIVTQNASATSQTTIRYFAKAAADRDLTISGGSVSGLGTEAIKLFDVKDVSITDSAISSTNGLGIQLENDNVSVDTVTIKNNTFTSTNGATTTYAVSLFDMSNEDAVVICEGNTFTDYINCIGVFGSYGNVRCASETIEWDTNSPGVGILIGADTVTLDWITATAYTTSSKVKNNNNLLYRCILNHTSDAAKEPGVGADWETYWVLERIGRADICGCEITNNLEFLPGTSGVPVGITAGAGVSGGVIENNKITNVDLGIKFGGNSQIARGNICTARHPLYVQGAWDCTLENNTAKAIHGNNGKFAYCIITNAADGLAPFNGPYPLRLKAINNILDASLGDGCYHDDAITGSPFNAQFDYNCLNASTVNLDSGDGVIYYLGTTNYTDLPSIQSKWASGTYGAFLGNDINSIEEDPQLDGDYIPQNPNVKTGGEPNVNNDETSIGAIQVGTATTTEISIMGPTVINILGPN